MAGVETIWELHTLTIINSWWYTNQTLSFNNEYSVSTAMLQSSSGQKCTSTNSTVFSLPVGVSNALVGVVPKPCSQAIPPPHPPGTSPCRCWTLIFPYRSLNIVNPDPRDSTEGRYRHINIITCTDKQHKYIFYNVHKLKILYIL